MDKDQIWERIIELTGKAKELNMEGLTLLLRREDDSKLREEKTKVETELRMLFELYYK